MKYLLGNRYSNLALGTKMNQVASDLFFPARLFCESAKRSRYLRYNRQSAINYIGSNKSYLHQDYLRVYTTSPKNTYLKVYALCNASRISKKRRKLVLKSYLISQCFFQIIQSLLVNHSKCVNPRGRKRVFANLIKFPYCLGNCTYLIKRISKFIVFLYRNNQDTSESDFKK